MNAPVKVIDLPWRQLIGCFALCINVLALEWLSLRPAVAVHLDIEVWGQGNALFAGYCRTPGIVGCDLDGLAEALGLPANSVPVETATGKFIFPADFQDLTGGPFRTRNPGFQSIQNALLPNELLGYRALGKLKYWDPALSSWRDAPPEVQIRLFGGLEASSEVLRDYSQCAGQLICLSEGSFGADGSTVFSGTGILGSPELVVDITNANGILHTHLSFFLENQSGQPGGPAGAYLIEMQLLSNARFFPSEPFLILFNAGLEPAQFAAALTTLIGEPGGGDPLPQPVRPVSIPGDVDLDGDVDRIDVALILLAAQNNEALKPANSAFDVDKDGVISRVDALLAKSLCTLRLCISPLEAPATSLNVAAIFDHQTGMLNLNDIKAGTQHFRAQLQVQEDQSLLLTTLQIDKSRYAKPSQYDIATGILTIPAVFINGKFFQATLRAIDAKRFQVIQLEEISGILER